MSATRRELLEERWKVAMTQPARFKNEAGISGDNSKRWYRINDTLEELAAILVDEVSDEETASLTTATEGIWKSVEHILLHWAEWLEDQREQRHAKAREYLEPYLIKEGDPRLAELERAQRPV